jgi:hypothetical protein
METQQTPPSQLTDEELRQAAKKLKSDSIISAVLIGFMAGIIVFSVFMKAVGWYTFIPLFMIYVFVKNDRKNYALRAELKKRNMK